MSAKESKVHELVEHFANDGDIGAYSTGIESVLEARVKALVDANKAEQLREHFGLQEAVEPETVPEPDAQPETQPEPEATPAGDTEVETQTQPEPATEPEPEQETKPVEEQTGGAGAEAEQEQEETPEPSHITESFKSFVRKRK